MTFSFFYKITKFSGKTLQNERLSRFLDKEAKKMPHKIACELNSSFIAFTEKMKYVSRCIRTSIFMHPNFIYFRDE